MFIKIIRYLLILAFCLLVFLYLIFSPSYVSQAIYKGRTIKIDRDQYGVATIHASSIEDYLYAMGTIVAEDRLFQITFKSYALQGRLSEFLGEKSLDHDKFMRELNLRKWADLRAERFRKENQTEYLKFEALSKGINDRVAKMIVLPMQFYLTGVKWQNFTVANLFYTSIQMEWGMAMNADDEYTRSAMLANLTKQQIRWLLPNHKETWAFRSQPIVADHEIPERLRTQNIQSYLDKVRFDPLSVERFVKLDIIQQYSRIDKIEATNSWAISGNLTETGLPMIVNDPHVDNSIPSTWYYIKLNYTRPNGKSYLAGGACSPGSSQFFGKHGYFSSAYSVLHCDNQDFFRQRIEGNKYFVDGQWRNLKIRNQTILVKTAQGLKAQTYQVKQTHRGPIVHYLYSRMGSYTFKDDSLSIAWTGFHDNWETPIRMTHMMFADNLQNLRNYMQNGTSGFTNLNILSITEDNHIIMQQSGMHPIRKNPQSGIFIKDGTTTEHDWVGVVPPHDRMHIVDPPKGYIINANNRLAESGYYGGYLDYTAYTARADRIDELIRAQLASGKKINAQFAKKILMDTVDVYCRQILPEILDVLPESRELLATFDCDLTAESYQASVYEIYLYQLYHLMKPLNPEKMCVVGWHQMPQGIYNYIHFAFRGDESKRKIMKDAWSKVKPYLTSRFNTEDVTRWKWGELHLDHSRHMVFRGHPILSNIFGLKTLGRGNTHTCNMYRADLVEWGNFETTLRAGLRAIYGYGKGFQDLFVIDHGISENILSGHYSDQWQLLKKGELINLFGQSEKHLQL